MIEVATKKDIDRLGDRLDSKIDKAVKDLSEIIGVLAQSTHNQLEEIRQEQVELRRSIDRLTNTVDGPIARIDHYETEQAARDAQFNRLLSWARKVSKKTGIPLENL